MTRTGVVRALVASLLGALLLGAVGLLLALRNYPLYEATMQIRVEPDPVVGAEGRLISEDDLDSFLAGELVVLNGPELRTSLGELLPPDVEVSVRTEQLGSTTVVEIAATADTPAAARQGADAVAARYAGWRREDLLERIASVRAQVDAQLARANARINELAGQTGVTSDVQRAALTAEYTRLIEQRNELQLAADGSSRLVSVVKPPDVGGVTQLVSPARDAALGALLGGVLGLTAALGLSRWRGRVTGLDDLLELAPALALPTLPLLSGKRVAERAGNAAAAHVSTLTPSTGGFAQPALVVLAPQPRAGATFTAVALAVAAARRGPTVLLAAGDAVDGAAARLLGITPADLERASPGKPIDTAYEGLTYVPGAHGTGAEALAELEQRVVDDLLATVSRPGVSVVVDAPALSVSSAALDLARRGGQALLVGGVDRTRAADLDVAATAVRRVGATVAGVVLSTPPGRLVRWQSSRP